MDRNLLSSMLEQGCVTDEMLKIIMQHCLDGALSQVSEPFGTVSSWYVKDQLETVKKCLELLGAGADHDEAETK